MNKDMLERKLEAMPKTELSHDKKEQMLHSIMTQQDKKKFKNSRRKKFGWLAPIGGTIIVSLLVWLLVVPNFDNTTPQASFLAEDQLANIPELEKFSGMIQLPTYAPFSVGEVLYQELGVTIDNLVYGTAQDPETIQPSIDYISSEGLQKQLNVFIVHTSQEELVGLIRHDEIIEFGDGLEGEYYATEGEQFDAGIKVLYQDLAWIDDDLFISIKVTSPLDNPIPVEELVKIAESFKLYEIDNKEN